jgi:hypothetical protein
MELSKVPETMDLAEQYKEQRDTEKKLLATNEKLRERIKKNHQSMVRSLRRQQNILSGTEVVVSEKKVFFMPCPSATCNGMLSSKYKCGICDNYTCPDCHELKDSSRSVEHVCNADNIASAQAIKKETKQCPGCHNRIYRTEGCSQMWCTGCHTTFDWTTGNKVVSGPLHNPHWLEYQRKNGGGQAPRAPGDVPCGGLCSRSDLLFIMDRIRETLYIKHDNVDWTKECELDYITYTSQLNAMFRFVGDITNNFVRETRERCQNLHNFQSERVRYIVGEISKTEFSDHIYNNGQTRKKNIELLHIYELLSMVGIDTFRHMLDTELNGDMYVHMVEEQIVQYNNLRLHVNPLLATISNTYGHYVPQITEQWNIDNKKFSSASLARLCTA